ncbi:hypothetical protein AGMMS50293_13860 [Spirochaetia bacterium]|nr:hypothetical protein AGMMS50293_13860 [Spirochaetia bacterium]
MIDETAKAEEFYQKFKALVKPDVEFGLPDIPDDNVEEALRFLDEAASRGHVLAMSELGISYLHGLGVDEDPDKAETLLRKAAASGEPNAQFTLYTILVQKAASREEFREAFEFLMQAAEQDFPQALFELGMIYYHGTALPLGSSLAFPQDYARAADYWQRAAKTGASEATGHLALLYLYGNGVEKDPQKALALLTQAAEADSSNIFSWYNLGTLFLGGMGDVGVPVNYPEAIKWLEKAAEYGHLHAHHNLGIAYRDGLGVEQDLNKALQCFLMASGALAEEEELAWPTVPEACYEAGKMFLEGQGVDEPDYGYAVECLEKAAEMGLQEAKDLLEAIEKAASEDEEDNEGDN